MGTKLHFSKNKSQKIWKFHFLSINLQQKQDDDGKHYIP